MEAATAQRLDGVRFEFKVASSAWLTRDRSAEETFPMNLTTPQVRRISPMLAVEDMDATLGFYSEVLGFDVSLRSPSYSIVERDGATVHFMKAASEEVMRAVRGHTEIYIEVSDIASLWEHVSRLKKDYRIRDLFDREYGMREFHISDPNDCLVFIGQRIS